MGDSDALEELGLDNITYPRPTPSNTAGGRLQLMYNATLNTAVVARALQIPFVEKQCQTSLSLLKAIAVAKKIELEHTVDGQDVAEIMLALIDEETQRLRSVQPKVSETESGSENQEEVLPMPLPGTAALYEDVAKSSQVAAVVSDAPTLSETTAVSKDVSASPSTSLVKDIPSSSCTEVENQLSEVAAVVNDAATLKETTAVSKDVWASPSTSVIKDIPSSSCTPVTSVVGDQQPSAAAPAPSSYISDKSKKKRWQCALCPFFGTHLQRHIAAKHPQSFTSKTEQMTLVHKHDKLSPKQKKNEERRFQCTYKKCGSIVTRLGQHLSRVHKIKDPKELKQVKANCLRLSSGSSRKRKGDAKAPNWPKTKASKISVAKPHQRQGHDTDEESDDEDIFESGGSTTDEHIEVDHHQLKVDADVDDISSFADSDKDEHTIPQSDQQKWRDSYLAKNPNRNLQEYFMSCFYILPNSCGGWYALRTSSLNPCQASEHHSRHPRSRGNRSGMSSET